MTFIETMTKGFLTFSAAASAEIPRRRLAWGLFWRFLAVQSGVLFFAAAVICFFAYNWTELSSFAKFGFIAFLMALSAVPALLRGFSSSLSHAGLLLCGILGGVLFAVYGQVYQTGADAWELFRAWTFWLFPLFLISRRPGVFFTLWLVATLWISLYLGLMDDITLVFLCMQAFVWAAFETASRFCSSKALPFLAARWIPRCIGILLLVLLTVVISGDYIPLLGSESRYSRIRFSWTSEDTGIILLSLFTLAGGGYWHTRVRRDLFMIAAGLLSLIVLILQLLLVNTKNIFDPANLFLMSLTILGLSAAAGKLLIHLHGRFKEAASFPGSEDTAAGAKTEEDFLPRAGEEESETPPSALPSLLSLRVMRFVLWEKVAGGSAYPPAAEEESSPWVARALMGACAWIVVPVLILLLVLLLETLDLLSLFNVIVISFIFLAAGIAFSGQRGIFIRQAVFCITLAAAITLSASIVFEYFGSVRDPLIFVPALVVFSISAVLTRDESFRFFSSASIVLLVSAQLDHYFFRGAYWASGNSGVPVYMRYLFLHRTLSLVLFSSLAAALALFWEKSGDFISKPLRCLNKEGVLAALMVVGLASAVTRNLPFGRTLLFSLMPCGVGVGIGLLVFAFRLSAELSLSKAVRAAIFVLCLAVACVSYRLPWFGVGLFVFALARYAASFSFFGLSVFYTAFCVVMEYYNQTTTLLDKSKSLALVTAGLTLTALALQALLSSALKKGNLAIPDALAGFCKPSGGGRGSRMDSALRMVLCAAMAFFMVSFVHSVYTKEALLAHGEPVVLELTPRDPRSLMQGDYMTLGFELEREISRAVSQRFPGIFEKKEKNISSPTERLAVIEPDERGVYRYVALYDPSIPLTGKQKKIIYRLKKGGVSVTSGSFFFQEGTGKEFEAARYADLRVDDEGRSLIVDLRNQDIGIIDPSGRRKR
ncbi:MAG: GDYXXLXY domain-containing protein [Candidatus Accumulibacter sp.]|jgi:uncharacterized membrane-anchored protein|nr:GDYXXLXY domain-containing protein [Accumulibacter sp.]